MEVLNYLAFKTIFLVPNFSCSKTISQSSWSRRTRPLQERWGDAGAISVLSSLSGCTKERSRPHSQFLPSSTLASKHCRHDFFLKAQFLIPWHLRLAALPMNRQGHKAEALEKPSLRPSSTFCMFAEVLLTSVRFFLARLSRNSPMEQGHSRLASVLTEVLEDLVTTEQADLRGKANHSSALLSSV